MLKNLGARKVKASSQMCSKRVVNCESGQRLIPNPQEIMPPVLSLSARVFPYVNGAYELCTDYQIEETLDGDATSKLPLDSL